jgi:hypothetical protein
MTSPEGTMSDTATTPASSTPTALAVAVPPVEPVGEAFGGALDWYCPSCHGWFAKPPNVHNGRRFHSRMCVEPMELRVEEK